jgi:pentatricopeptide repeat protein
MTLAEKAESLMVRMETIDALPDEVSYNTLIKIWSKTGLTDRAESVFEKMKKRGSKSSPTPMTYVSLLDAYAHSISTHAHGKNIQAIVERAKVLLGEMNSVLKRIPTIAYNAYLNILSKTHNMIEAESVLESMENNADTSSRPDVLSYCTLINGWARNSRNDKAQKAHCILMRLLCRHANGDTPGIFNNGSVEKVRNAYNMTIMACAFTGKHTPLDDRVKAMGIAHEILLSMRTSKWFHPTTATYELLFQGYSVWLSDVTPEYQKYQIPFDTLQLCIEDGLVSNTVVERFINVTSQDFRKSVHYQGFSLGRFDEIPSEWSRNIKRCA